MADESAASGRGSAGTGGPEGGPGAEAHPPLPPFAERHVGGLLNHAAQAVQGLANEALEPLGIEIRHFIVLKLLAEAGPLSQHAIGHQLRIDRTTMVSLIDELEAAGHVRRERNPRDRRAYAVTPTRPGLALQARAQEALDDCDRRFLAPLSASERRQLRELLVRLVRR